MQSASGFQVVQHDLEKLQRTAGGEDWSIKGTFGAEWEAGETDYGYALRKLLLEPDTVADANQSEVAASDGQDMNNGSKEDKVQEDSLLLVCTFEMRGHLDAELQPQIVEWEEQCTLVLRVPVNGIYIARRADNSFINATNLLEAVGTTREWQAATLERERYSNTVTQDPPEFRGVWVPHERGLDLAYYQGIAEKFAGLASGSWTRCLIEHKKYKQALQAVLPTPPLGGSLQWYCPVPGCKLVGTANKYKGHVENHVWRAYKEPTVPSA